MLTKKILHLRPIEHTDMAAIAKETTTPVVTPPKLWYTARKNQVPVSYKKLRKDAKQKRNHSPEKTAQPYIRTREKKSGEESDSEEEYFDGTDMTIKQTW